MTTSSISLGDLIARHKPGYALEQAFYQSEEVFQQDLKRVFHHEWQWAGHVSELCEVGDYFLFEMMDESVIITRGNDGEIHALANVCRHRGSRVCIEPRGNTKRFTCPYHAWIFNLDGSLFNARLLDKEFDRTKLGLKRVAVEVFHGMIFVSLADNPDSFETLRQELDPVLQPFGLTKTKVAHRVQYPVKANWKLLVENYNECYHCTAAHPEFSRSHATHMAAERVEPLNSAMVARAQDCGVPTDFIDRIAINRQPGSPEYAYNRYSLFEGFATGSEDGKPLAPLLGHLKGYDSGASDLYVGILNPMLIYCDHLVIYRFIPVDKDNSIQEILWLVREDAVAGDDYDLDRLAWLWNVTTESDKTIIEKNQEGVNSRFYEPGPFVEMETYTKRFVDSYLRSLENADPE
ncbi:aromatic ring-hydroxylating dioxygenase subunit alpha (plasmid) [Parasedimentitalea marina]|uniref:Aromatic ring-hydroxylating dioxygenase subunit alpha n=1 Tax=Parasedimentitalea marina TaxID=2483033 RepID=A0A3T0NAF0_9RHOB|nr:aromatic ring-hydroxylating dioxygenase subunit alpha [Parasedimentitalea marina]AZV80969.1 aromatic ring-hydroxylating dioxygenase subunit alpha [Parasedimentitalea marina]